ncbi:hypothetical protein OX88_27200 [Pseudomonas coronafaciens pv. porri]|uniref:hypothetical protein n=1 Tax=Pseudomonas coronafaciens TaxID=53409 RepID=UPI0006ABC8D7|nr:hypothetical protein [Pseudomonas coronafaciens]KOP50884.1 hypothetical protein OX88_27200 [Pseudomonas coronafaciens pv. porri]
MEYEELKIQLEIVKKDLSASAKRLAASKKTLTSKVGLLKFHENLTEFTDYVCDIRNNHNHLNGMAALLRNHITKKSNVTEEIREGYLSELVSHMDIHNKYIRIKIALKHRTVYILPNELVKRKYETFFVDDGGKKKENLDIIEEFLNKQIEENNNGKPAIKKIYISSCKKKTKKQSETEIAEGIKDNSGEDFKNIITISHNDLKFNNYALKIEWTNGVIEKIDLYDNAVYHKDNAKTKDKKLEKTMIFRGEGIELNQTKDDVITKIINDKEKTNE